jgi:hypothetical protein
VDEPVCGLGCGVSDWLYEEMSVVVVNECESDDGGHGCWNEYTYDHEQHTFFVD